MGSREWGKWVGEHLVPQGEVERTRGSQEPLKVDHGLARTEMRGTKLP